LARLKSWIIPQFAYCFFAVSFQQTGLRRKRPVRYLPIFLCALVLCLLSVSSASDKQRFDGKWVTTVSCPAAKGALGYSYQFTSTVADGVLHGLHGTEGAPSSLQIDGTIPPDGDASLYAKGRTGPKEYVVGGISPPGTEYGYNIQAHFGDSAGTGTRVEGRPCSVKFVKQ
jgi:hypothetical protein